MFALTVSLVAIALAIIYFYVNYSYSYWQRRGIPYLKPSFPFGNFSKAFIRKWPFCVQLNELYRSTSEPFIGTFMLQSPILLIRDPNLIRSILITDFQYFTDRNFYLNEKEEPLTAYLGTLRGQQWRDMRTKLTPAFSPSKIKMTFSVILGGGNQLQQHLSKVVNGNEATEMFEIIKSYASNITASVAFGNDIDFFADPKHPFRNAVQRIFEINLKNLFRFFGRWVNPTLLKWSRLRLMDRDVEEYFLNLVKETIEMRERNNIVRNDYLQSLIEVRTSDSNNDEWKTVTEKSERKSLSHEQLAAQAFNFFVGGVEGASLTTSYCLYEIAKHPEVQRKIHAEIGDVMAEHNGQITYESINELKYLDCCLEESLRKYPLLHLNRMCVKDYKIPNTDVIIEKGTSIIIPAFALHHDEKFYPDPKKFDPTRFCSEKKAGKNNSDMPFLSFGDGPRNCIGRRLGKMMAKVGICSILQRYHVELDDRHIGKELKLSLNMDPLGGVHLKMKTR